MGLLIIAADRSPIHTRVAIKEAALTDDLNKLIEAARKLTPSEKQRDEHRRSFVFGNTAIENDLITREMVDREADELARERDGQSSAP